MNCRRREDLNLWWNVGARIEIAIEIAIGIEVPYRGIGIEFGTITEPIDFDFDSDSDSDPDRESATIGLKLAPFRHTPSFIGAPSDLHDGNRPRVEDPTPNFQISFNPQAPNLKRDER